MQSAEKVAMNTIADKVSLSKRAFTV